jgi:hypothetical protein
MPEVQKHGFDFENWVKDSFFGQILVTYTEKWDIPAQFNLSNGVPAELRGLPVSVKTCKYGGQIGFGDALRQHGNAEDFLLVVGFWEQAGAYKNFVAVEGVKVTTAAWRSLFFPLKEEDIKKLDALIKNRDLHYTDVRQQAQAIKKLDNYINTKIVLNPKVDSKNQRRLQCSVPFNVFWSEFAKKPAYKNVDCELFGKKVPNPLLSSARVFHSN